MSIAERLAAYAADGANFGSDADQGYAATLANLVQGVLAKFHGHFVSYGTLLHRVFHILANIEIEPGEWSYAADLCFSEAMRPRANRPMHPRYDDKRPITHVVLRDARAFLHMACALSLFEELSQTKAVGPPSMAFERGWHYCVYCPEEFEKTPSPPTAAARMKTKELSFSRKVRCSADDHAFLFGKGTVVLEWCLLVCSDDKYARMRNRISASIMTQPNAYEWLHTCPQRPYIEAMKRQPLLDARDVFKAYEFLFYVFMENCSAHLSDVGGVVARDPVSGRPLCFRIRDKEAFCNRMLTVFMPQLKPDGSVRPSHEKIDITRVGPLVLSSDLSDEDVNMAVKNEDEWMRKLAKLYKRGDFFRATGGIFLSELLYDFVDNTRAKSSMARQLYESPQPCLLHLSLYTPNFQSKQYT